MEGMIFAAGLGTRLRPLTNDRPKALMEVAGKPLLEHVIRKMTDAGIRRIVVNVHHFADQIEDFLDHHLWKAEILVSDERESLLDTGGGLRKARDMFHPGEAILIHNVDIFSEVDLSDLIASHQQKAAFATLVVRPGGKGRGLRFNSAGLLKGWENSVTGEQKRVDDEFVLSRHFSFCGIQVVSAEFLQEMRGRGIFSIIDEYLEQAKHHPISMYSYHGFFRDLGTPEAIVELDARMKNHCNPLSGFYVN